MCCIVTRNSLAHPLLFILNISRRQEAIQRQPNNVEINLLDPPRLLHLRPVIAQRLPVPEDGRRRLPAVRDVDPFHVPVLLDLGLHAGFPEHALVALRRLHPDQLRVRELDQEPGSLAEVAPDGVVDDLGVRGALGPEDFRAGFELQGEAIFVGYGFFADAYRV